MPATTSRLQKTEIILVDDGTPCVTIVIPDEASEAVTEGVHELNYWIRRITGVTLPVATESTWNQDAQYIAIGGSALTRANGWDAEPFAQEEARVFILPDRIGLVGNDEAPYPGIRWWGTYYAVLEFVRHALKVRWIWPGPLGEVFTSRRTLSVAAGKWSWEPEFKLMREIRNFNKIRLQDTLARAEADFAYWAHQPEARTAAEKLAEEQDRWLKRQRMNLSSDVRFAHAFGDWWDLYGEKHPDWFAKPPAGVEQQGGRDVKLNISHPAVADQVIANWQKKRQQNPARHRILPVSPNDGRGFDTRPMTRAWDHPSLQAYSDEEIYNSPEPILTDRYVKFWNIIARHVAAIDPEVLVTSFAYRNYRTPPLGFERLEPNIVIAYVGGEGYYPDERYVQEEWLGWYKHGATMVWRPNLLHTGYGAPYLFARQLHEDFRFFRDHGMQGTYFDSMTGNWAGQGLVYYVLAEQHVRPEASYEELAEEYFAAFGPAAAAVREYHEFFEEEAKRVPALIKELTPSETWGGWWVAYIRCIPAFLTPAVLARAESIIVRAEEAVERGDKAERARVQFLRLGFDHARLMAKTFGRLKLHKPDGRVTFADAEAKAILQPLWDFRVQASAHYLLPVLRYLLEEQRRLGLWTAFLTPDAARAVNKSSASQILSGTWSYCLDPDNKGLKAKWYATIDSRWLDVLPDQPGEEILWQRFIFRAPVLPDTGARFVVEIDGGLAATHVWLNGHIVVDREEFAGVREEGTVMDVSRLILDGAENVLVVRLKGSSDILLRPEGVRVRYTPTV